MKEIQKIKGLIIKIIKKKNFLENNNYSQNIKNKNMEYNTTINNNLISNKNTNNNNINKFMENKVNQKYNIN